MSYDEPATPVFPSHDEEIAERFLSVNRSSQDTPERALLRAILEDGIRCALDHRAGLPCKERAAEIHRAREWIESNSTDYVFSFLAVCAALNLEPGAIRRLVRARMTIEP
jgi:hypothetical protein